MPVRDSALRRVGPCLLTLNRGAALVTAATEKQAEAYRLELELRKRVVGTFLPTAARSTETPHTAL